ncbi:MAG: hypothetical protein J6S91_04605 [Treponema sp.]|nr:hypothetical protein [Treponema sp.]
MKRSSIITLSVSALMLAATPVFAQEESLFQADPIIQEQTTEQEEFFITDVLDAPLFLDEAVEQTPVQVVYKKAMSEANSRVLNDLNKQTQNKADAIIARNKSRRTPQDLIASIENLKQQYLQQASGLNNDNDAYVLEMQEKCEAEIQERMLEEQRLAELESDGVTLNSRGQKRLENDIAGIKEKYQKQIESYKKNSVNAQTQKSLLTQINSSLRSLESSTYVQSSISDDNLVLSIGEYDGTKDVWPYTLVLYLGDVPVVTYTGNLSYSDISGKQIPAVPRYTADSNDPKAVEYKKYLDSVEIFDASFKTEPLFIEAQLAYTVKAKNPSDASSYTVTVNSVLLKNIITEKTINSYNKRESVDFSYSTVSPVDWTSSVSTLPEAPSKNITKPQEKPNKPSFKEDFKQELKEDFQAIFNIFPPISIVINVPDSKEKEPENNTRVNTDKQEKKEEKKEEKKQAPSEKNKNTISQENINNTRETARRSEQTDSKKSVSALLYCLPGTVNFYTTPDGEEGAVALGYNMQFSVCPYLFLGLNLEFGLGSSTLFSKNTYSGGGTGYESGSGSSGGSSAKNHYYCDDFYFDELGFYLITGQIGSYLNLNNNIRFNYFGEAGICSDNFVAGAGCSFEFYSNNLNLGVTAGYTGLLYGDFNFLNKLSFGVEFLF